MKKILVISLVVFLAAGIAATSAFAEDDDSQKGKSEEKKIERAEAKVEKALERLERFDALPTGRTAK